MKIMKAEGMKNAQTVSRSGEAAVAGLCRISDRGRIQVFRRWPRSSARSLIGKATKAARSQPAASCRRSLYLLILHPSRTSW